MKLNMSKSHTWFGTKRDTDVIISWFREEGGRQHNGDPLDGEWVADGREVLICFPAIGPVKYWPEDIHLPEIGDNSSKAKREILAKVHQREQPEMTQIDVDRSAVAGLKLPEFRDGRYWVAGHIWFPTIKLKEVFPELSRVCRKFERFIKSHPVVFDNSKGENKSVFEHQICSSGILHQIFAFPEAYGLLKRGDFMVDYLTSSQDYAYFRWRLQQSGLEQPPYA